MENRKLSTGLSRGALGRCPECGKGGLFRAYLKVKPTCEACGHDIGEYPADDGPAYITILLVGHLIIAPVLLFPFVWEWHPAAVLGLLIPLLIAVILVSLPVAKGAVVGMHWAAGIKRAPH
ncbi:DUF983 domain-containing protein [Brevundimonas sp. 2R-24]|uniref:DUF983 domain-containing protein n=1 Tax=Peiella sedimenti TaxID=3061083 RepID=A0ABT8SKX6_9CAUL|nr:DUF983 domain-containing protein [Caulobacteraceae bacterium XZ-24]